MTVERSLIQLRGVRLFGHHGVLPQERQVGACFIVDISLETDFSQAMATDDLSGTVSYAEVFHLLRDEMAVPSGLLEHVGGRICRAILDRFPAVSAVHLQLLKENPPMGADCTGAGVSLSVRR